MNAPRRYFAVARGAPRPVPPPLRAPFGWPIVALAADAPITLTWPNHRLSDHTGGWLRFTTSVDDRENRHISVRLAMSGQVLGACDIRHAPSLTPCELRLDAKAVAAAVREGLVLSVEGGSRPLWLLAPGLPPEAVALAPHLLSDVGTGAAAQVFFNTLASSATLQPFGWMEGCVLDGLYDLYVASGDRRFHRALQVHFNAFVHRDGKLIYENPRGEVADGKLITIEATLPFGVFAKVDPEHPLLGLALDFWRTRTTAAGVIQDGDTLSAEGAYTIAYPLALIAGVRGDADLARLAAEQLRVRCRRLWHEGARWLRCTDRGERTFRNWARGVAWYFLGLVRTTSVLHAFMDTTEFEAEVRACAAFVRRHQGDDGLWACFFGEPSVSADTSGSAGIAAALALGHRAGWLEDSDKEAAARTWAALLRYLTPDGLLGGAAPANRGGEALQRSSHRVLSPIGMGLMGQLAAALSVAEINPPSNPIRLG